MIRKGDSWELWTWSVKILMSEMGYFSMSGQGSLQEPSYHEVIELARLSLAQTLPIAEDSIQFWLEQVRLGMRWKQRWGRKIERTGGRSGLLCSYFLWTRKHSLLEWGGERLLQLRKQTKHTNRESLQGYKSSKQLLGKGYWPAPFSIQNLCRELQGCSFHELWIILG
jgi:hypothetical protein